MSCSECGYRTSNVKSAGKHLGDLAPYCDHKMEFIRAKAQLEKDEICLDAILCADLPCPICGEVMDVVVRRNKFDHFECKVHGEQEPMSSE
jgi:C4-type Zn-finger protein